jgi:hypothetical protein
MRNESSKSSPSPYQHNDFIKAIMEQQKIAQQQELEHQHKLQQEQQVYRTHFFHLQLKFSCIRNKNVNVKNLHF